MTKTVHPEPPRRTRDDHVSLDRSSLHLSLPHTRAVCLALSRLARAALSAASPRFKRLDHSVAPNRRGDGGAHGRCGSRRGDAARGHAGRATTFSCRIYEGPNPNTCFARELKMVDPRGSGQLFFMFIRPQPYTCLGIECHTHAHTDTHTDPLHARHPLRREPDERSITPQRPPQSISSAAPR